MLSMPRIVRPDPHRIRGRNLVPPLNRPLADPLSETKNWRDLLTGKCGSHVSHSLRAYSDRLIGDEPVPDSRLGFNQAGRSWVRSKRPVKSFGTDTRLRTRRSSDLSQMIINPVNRD